MTNVSENKVYDRLEFGRKNAIPAKQLAMSLGYPSVRDLQKQIERERAGGAVILSDHIGGGYYKSNDPDELRAFIRTLKARAANTMRSAVSAQKALDAILEQQMYAGESLVG